MANKTFSFCDAGQSPTHKVERKPCRDTRFRAVTILFSSEAAAADYVYHAAYTNEILKVEPA